MIPEIKEVLKDRENLIVGRDPAHGDVLKVTEDVETAKHLANEFRILKALELYDVAPQPLQEWHEEGMYVTYQEYIGHDPPRDLDVLLAGAVKLLSARRALNIKHGDLTAPNIRICGDMPFAIDFQESRISGEGWDKRPEPDSFHLLSALQDYGDPRRVIKRWLAIRQELPASCNGLTLLDIGCHLGDLTALASAEGFNAIGVDYDSAVIDEATHRFGQLPSVCRFMHLMVDEIPKIYKRGNVALVLSTYAYWTSTYGEVEAYRLLEEIIRGFDVVFFESQSVDDGPGPGFFGDQLAIGAWLQSFVSTRGTVSPVVTVDIVGRPAIRTTFKVIHDLDTCKTFPE